MSAATFWTVKLGPLGTAPVWGLDEAEARRKRRVSVDALNALEFLGHAIDYLTEDLIATGRPFKLTDPRIQAAIMLMQKSREIFFECPEVPSFVERFRAWIGLRAA